MSSIDPSRYVYRPGESEVAEVDLDETVIHDAVTGERVTEADLDREAAERWPGLTPGGKSLSGDGTHSPVLRVVVSRETADRVKQRAYAQRMSVSRYLRSLIERDVS